MHPLAVPNDGHQASKLAIAKRQRFASVNLVISLSGANTDVAVVVESIKELADVIGKMNYNFPPAAYG